MGRNKKNSDAATKATKKSTPLQKSTNACPEGIHNTLFEEVEYFDHNGIQLENDNMSDISLPEFYELKNSPMTMHQLQYISHKKNKKYIKQLPRSKSILKSNIPIPEKIELETENEDFSSWICFDSDQDSILSIKYILDDNIYNDNCSKKKRLFCDSEWDVNLENSSPLTAKEYGKKPKNLKTTISLVEKDVNTIGRIDNIYGTNSC